MLRGLLGLRSLRRSVCPQLIHGSRERLSKSILARHDSAQSSAAGLFCSLSYLDEDAGDMIAKMPSLSVRPEHVASDASPHLILEICRGRTKFPRRPVLADQFMIGAGRNCDLHMGGDGMPTLHSILSVSGNEIRIEAVASRPPLIVNDEVRQTASLGDGDHIQIGGIEFVVHKTPCLAADAQPADQAGSSDVMVREFGSGCDADLATSDASGETPDLSELSASELVELIEQDEELIAEFDDLPESGVEGLLDAVLLRAEAMIAQQESSDVAGDVDEVEFVLNQLHEMAAELEQRSERLSRREADYATAAETLLDAQRNLADQLETLLGQVSARDDAAQPRAVA